MLKIRTVVTSMAQSNCYLVMDLDTKKGLIVDPGGDAEKIERAIDSIGMVPEAIMLTHGHFDHITAAPALKEKYGIPAVIGEKDAETALDPRKNLSLLFTGSPASVRADREVRDDEVLSLFMPVTVLETPGHTPGGVCYYLQDEGLLFTGDTLFYGSVGRTDFPGGSMQELTESIRKKLFVLPDDTRVYPGHGYPTSIGFEKAYNPFLTEDTAENL